MESASSRLEHGQTSQNRAGADALEMALWTRRPSAGLIHYIDHGTQTGFKVWSQRSSKELRCNNASGGCQMGRRGAFWAWPQHPFDRPTMNLHAKLGMDTLGQLAGKEHRLVGTRLPQCGHDLGSELVPTPGTGPLTHHVMLQ